MFKRRTLFILGAGASAEFGLPVGTGLAARIIDKMDIRFERGFRPSGSGDMDLFSRVTQLMRDQPNEFQTAAWQIRDGLPLAQSIDDFLDLHRGNLHINKLGKAAIAKSILEAERGSSLYFNELNREQFSPERLSDTWLVKFMYMLGRGVPKENAREIFDNVAFIVFNYDRCLEFFLLNALRRLYGISQNNAQDILNDLTIIHPYGVVGNVPFGSSNANYHRTRLRDKDLHRASRALHRRGIDCRGSRSRRVLRLPRIRVSQPEPDDASAARPSWE